MPQTKISLRETSRKLFNLGIIAMAYVYVYNNLEYGSVSAMRRSDYAHHSTTEAVLR